MTPRSLIAPARLAGIPVLRTQTDELLVDLVRAGNDAAFEAIVARYRRPLLRYCSRLLSEERAEDAVQQAFLRAYHSLRGSGSEMHLRPWLYRIAHNTALNVLRDGGIGDEELSDQIDGVERPDQAFEKSQRLRDVVTAVERLPERQRDAIVLRELEGRSYEEIAAALGVSDGAVRQLLNRARTTLRAGATAVTPVGLLTRAPWVAESGDGMATRVAELSAAGAGGAVLTKVCATALVTGAVFGGVATAPDDGSESSARPRPDHSSAAPGAPAGLRAGALTALESLDRRSGRVRPAAAPLATHDDDDRSGRRGGDDERSRSGPGSGTDDVDSNSGPGSNSGSGSGSSGSGSDGSGSGSSGSGSGGSGSGSGTSGSGSGSSGSGSSGSGYTAPAGSGSGELDGSGSSGSGSGGSGSGDSGGALEPDDGD